MLAVFFISCEKEDSTVIDPVLHFPHIDTAYVTPDLFDTSAVNSLAFAKVSSEEAIRTVTATVKNRLGVESVFILKDDGVLPDSVAGDGWYTGTISFTMSCRLVGDYNVNFIAENISGLISNNFPAIFRVINSQHVSPVISDLILVPDSTRVNEPTCVVIEVTVFDQNGSCDIFKVYYTGTRPNGQDLTPHNLYDDGSCCIVENTGLPSGDTTASDGKFTRKLCGPPDQVGYYKYNVRAINNSGDTSNVLSDSIYVYP